MSRRSAAALLMLLACGCSPSPPPDSGPRADATTPAVEVAMPESSAESSDGQTADAAAEAKLTLVSLNVPGMT